MNKTFNYKDLDIGLLLEAFDDDGIVRIELSKHSSKVCKQVLELLTLVSNTEFNKTPIPQKFFTIIKSLIISVRILFFHLALVEIVTLFFKRYPIWHIEINKKDVSFLILEPSTRKTEP